MTIKNAESIGTPALVRPSDIVSGNSKLITIFVAELFNTRHGLEELNEEEKEAFEKFGIVDDDVEGSRDERAFRLWINSLNIEDVYIDNLYDDCSTGLVFLKVLDKLQPGCVEWKTVDKNPNNPFKKGINCNQIVAIGVKKLGLKLPGISGQDFVDGKKKNILAVVWHLVRFHYMKIMGGTCEADLVKWANGLVQGEHKIKNLKDKEMSDGHFLLQVCSGIEPRAIDWDIVKKGEEEDFRQREARTGEASPTQSLHHYAPHVVDWKAGVGYTGDRLGFLLAGDLPAAVRVIRSAGATTMATRLAIKELLLFSVSPPYVQLRKELSLALPEQALAPILDLG